MSIKSSSPFKYIRINEKNLEIAIVGTGPDENFRILSHEEVKSFLAEAQKVRNILVLLKFLVQP